MGVDSLTLHFDNPGLCFYPGQVVSGQVHLKCNGEISTEGLKLTAVGRASLQWTESHGKNNTRVYKNEEEYFHIKFYLVGNGKDKEYIPDGEHTYPFYFTLPPNLPSSCKYSKGEIKYTVRATVKRAWRFDDKSETAITVLSYMNAHNLLETQRPKIVQSEKTVCCLCCASGPIVTDVNLNKTGFTPGEEVEMTIRMNNGSSRTINDMKLYLMEQITYRAYSGKLKIVEDEKFKLERNEGKIWPRNEDEWRAKFNLPSDLIPSGFGGGCNIMELIYYVKVKGIISGIGRNAVTEVKIIIGSPLPPNTEMPSADAWNANSGIIPPPPGFQTNQFPSAPYFPPIATPDEKVTENNTSSGQYFSYGLYSAT